MGTFAVLMTVAMAGTTMSFPASGAQASASITLIWVIPFWIMACAAVVFVWIYARNHNQKDTAQAQQQALEDALVRITTGLEQKMEQNRTELSSVLKEIHQTLKEQPKMPVQAAGNPQQAAPVAAAVPASSAPAPAKQSSVANVKAGSEIDTAQKLIQDREANHPKNLLDAKKILEASLTGAGAGDAYTLLAETCFWLGDYAQSDAEKDTYHGEGVEAGKKAVELKGNSVAANLWYAANMGAHGVVRGIMSSLFYLGPIEKHGKKAMDLDETFFHGAPLRLMGRFYHQCPKWPIGKGDMDKAVKLLEKAVKVGPHFLLNHFYLADAYLAKRKKDKARDLVKKVLDTDPQIFENYQRTIQSQAKELQSKL